VSRLLLAALCAGLLPAMTAAPPFQLPTANRSVLLASGGDAAFVATPGKTWESGTFGCVRSSGWKMHEGIDIHCLQRDRRGEPTDPVLASADGTVAYLSTKPALSNYGNYVVLRHYVEGLEVYTLYAHLASVRDGLRIGETVKSGDRIATMGRTTNTKEGITRDRAHLHFEVDLVLNDRYSRWHAKALPGTRNDHGNFNGHNLLGLDPWVIFLEQQRLGTNFSLVRFIKTQKELCHVAVRAKDFPWVRRYRQLVEPNPVATHEGIAGYELTLAFNGVPIRAVPRAESELRSKSRIQLLSVNDEVSSQCPCGRLVRRLGNGIQLQSHGEELLDLLTFSQ
jgi:murein DD-endopeptidase MepM/ murein hydrolase activator NlpD